MKLTCIHLKPLKHQHVSTCNSSTIKLIMKKQLLSLLFIMLPLFTMAQTYTTVANGDWDDPTIWDQETVPGSGEADSAIVLHEVTFSDFFVNLFYLEINNSSGKASLTLNGQGIESSFNTNYLSLISNAPDSVKLDVNIPFSVINDFNMEQKSEVAGSSVTVSVTNSFFVDGSWNMAYNDQIGTGGPVKFQAYNDAYVAASNDIDFLSEPDGKLFLEFFDESFLDLRGSMTKFDANGGTVIFHDDATLSLSAFESPQDLLGNRESTSDTVIYNNIKYNNGNFLQILEPIVFTGDFQIFDGGVNVPTGGIFRLYGDASINLPGEGVSISGPIQVQDITDSQIRIPLSTDGISGPIYLSDFTAEQGTVFEVEYFATSPDVNAAPLFENVSTLEYWKLKIYANAAEASCRVGLGWENGLESGITSLDDLFIAGATLTDTNIKDYGRNEAFGNIYKGYITSSSLISSTGGTDANILMFGSKTTEDNPLGGEPQIQFNETIVAGNWDNPEIWLSGSVPTNSDNVLVLHDVLIPDGVTATTNDLYMLGDDQSGMSRLILEATSILNVNGNFVAVEDSNAISSLEFLGAGDITVLGDMIFVREQEVGLPQSVYMELDNANLTIDGSFIYDQIATNGNFLNEIYWFNSTVDIAGGIQLIESESNDILNMLIQNTQIDLGGDFELEANSTFGVNGNTINVQFIENSTLTTQGSIYRANPSSLLDFTFEETTSLTLNGSSQQKILSGFTDISESSELLYFNDVVINNSSAEVPQVVIKDLGIFLVGGELNFQQGVLGGISLGEAFSDDDIDKGFLGITDSTTIRGADNNKYYDGGASAYISRDSPSILFPFGKNGRYMPLELSNVSLISGPTSIDAIYTDSALAPNNIGTLNNISSLESWVLFNNYEEINANISLFWSDASASGITNPNDLSVVYVDTLNELTNSGNLNNTGDLNFGSISSGEITLPVEEQLFFTFGSSSPTENPLTVNFLEDDSTALLMLYEDLLANDTQLNWTTGDNIDLWTGVTIENGSVTELNIPNLGLNGILSEDIFGISNLRSIDVSGNNLTSIPELVSMPALESVNVSGNLLDFSHLEPNIELTQFNYANQQNTLEDIIFLTEEINNTITFESTVGGTANTYQWYFKDQPIEGETGSVLTTTEIQRSDIGSYFVEVSNTIITDLTLIRDVFDLEVTADLGGTVRDIDGNELDEGIVMIFAETETFAFDTIRLTNINPGGSYLFNDLSAGSEYILLAVPNFIDYSTLLPTFFESALSWTDAQQIILNNNLLDTDISVQKAPDLGDVSEFKGEILGLLEIETEDESSRIKRTRSLTNGKATISRARGLRRVKDDDFVFYAYAESDENGEFNFSNLPPGTYRLNIEIPGIPMDSTTNEFEIGENQNFRKNLNALVTDDKITVTINDITSADMTISNIHVYPMPVKNHLMVKGLKGPYSFIVLDLNGREIKKGQLAPDEMIFVDDLKRGIYFLKLMKPGETAIPIKFVKH